jgi:hypothetical protein
MPVFSRWVAIASLILIPGISNAVIDNIPTENGWGGWVIFGVGYSDMKSNTVAGNKWIDIGNKNVSSLTASPESDEKVHPAFTGQVKYTFGDQWQAFIGSNLIDRITLDFTQQIGIRKQTDGGQKFGAGLLFSAMPTEVWEDPYQTSDVGGRTKTDRDSAGIRLEWDRILDSGANLTLDFRKVEIDKERIGQNVTDPNVNTCDVTCQGLLKRDGDFVQLEAAWAFKLSSRHRLRPAVRWFDADADGNAQDFSGYTALVSWSLLGENFTLAATGAYTDADYDNPNPIYGREQDSDGFTVDVNLFYKLSRDGRWQAVGGVTYGDSDSDIDFHDNELLGVTLGAYYSFGNQPNRWLKR